MICSKDIVVLKEIKEDGIAVECDNGNKFTINTNNIYDLIENTSIGTSEMLFVTEDENSSAVQLNTLNKGKSISVTAIFYISDFEHYVIADTSPTGLIKWLKRVFYVNQGNFDLFEIKIRG